MNLTRCAQGHFYDADLNATCPHCQNQPADATVAVKRVVTEDSVTTPIGATEKPLGGEISKLQNDTIPIPRGGNNDDDGVTVRFDAEKLGVDPVVGWLVCIEGPHRGEDFRLKNGKNFIGRDSKMDAALTKDKSVSRDKHAIVLYEPKAHMFLVQPGEARELCYLNDNVVLSAQELKRNDVISLGETKLMFFPCCDAAFNWGMVEIEKDN